MYKGETSACVKLCILSTCLCDTVCEERSSVYSVYAVLVCVVYYGSRCTCAQGVYHTLNTPLSVPKGVSTEHHNMINSNQRPSINLSHPLCSSQGDSWSVAQPYSETKARAK